MPLLRMMYYAGMYLLMTVIRISSLWNPKSSQWLEGRRNWKEKIRQVPAKNSHRIWFHVASLGEFEQARPVIEEIKRRNDSIDIILTFFSPSGYEIRKNYPLATVFYLSADLPGNARIFLRSIQPDVAVFTKYDLWPGYIHELIRQSIPAVLISANWTPGRKFSSWNFPLTKSLLKRFDRIFLQDVTFIDVIRKQGFQNISIAGDTRIDRSLALPNEVATRLPGWIGEMAGYDLVAGSTWEKDEEIIFDVIEKLNLRAIIAPHDVTASNINRLTKGLKLPFQLLSRFDHETAHRVLIVDTIGLLSVLYTAGKIAYIGGGFGKGIHNILEPAAHAKPIIFGPHYEKFPEAVHLLDKKAAWSVNTKEELTEAIGSLLHNDTRIAAGQNAFMYLKDRAGATAIVSSYLLDLLSEKSK